jgi:hypothetical protein
MSDRILEPDEFTVAMPEGGWQTDLGGKTDEVEQTCLDYLNRRHVRPGLAMHPDTYKHFISRLFVHHPKLYGWMPVMVRESFSHPRDTITFFDDDQPQPNRARS